MQRVDDLVEIAPRQIGAANAAGKERVTRDEQLQRHKMEANGPLRVTGRVKDLGWVAFESDDLTIFQIRVWRRGFRRLHSEPGGLCFHHLQLRQVRFVQEDWRAGKTLELEGAADVVNVGVRDQNLLQLEPQLSQPAMNAADFVPGIDNNGFAGLFIAQNGAIARQRPDRKGLEDHGLIVGPE